MVNTGKYEVNMVNTGKYNPNQSKENTLTHTHTHTHTNTHAHTVSESDQMNWHVGAVAVRDHGCQVFERDARPYCAIAQVGRNEGGAAEC